MVCGGDLKDIGVEVGTKVWALILFQSGSHHSGPSVSNNYKLKLGAASSPPHIHSLLLLSVSLLLASLLPPLQSPILPKPLFLLTNYPFV